MSNRRVTRSTLSRGSAPQLLAFALLLASLSSLLCADDSLPIDKITVDSVSVSAGKFFKSYMSPDTHERKDAELYLLGVMDATEGKDWCDYRTFKAVTLRERVFEEFNKLDTRHLDERASTVIERILSRRYPCGSTK